jgi:uncharacterized protein (TIGR03083 family)
MTHSIPIPTVHLFPVIDEKLIELLRSLSPEEWDLATLAKEWTVKDIAAHLLDGNIRTLSLARDKLQLSPVQPIHTYQELVDYLNQLNAVWVNAAKRISPGVLIELLEITGKQYSAYLRSIDPFSDAIFPVAWAGEPVSKNWFHIAREYTEKFHHQLQIRDAVNRPGLIIRELFYPFIDTFMRALPHTYRNTNATEGTTVKITVTTDAGGDWFIRKEQEKWILAEQRNSPTATITFDPDTAWKLFSKGMSPAEARNKVVLSGNTELAGIALTMLSVMA